jgi:hypothetical protein
LGVNVPSHEVSVSTQEKVEGFETSKYARAFFKILMMSETTENHSPNNGQTSEFEISDINRLLKQSRHQCKDQGHEHLEHAVIPLLKHHA